jgi:hypothetical protein
MNKKLRYAILPALCALLACLFYAPAVAAEAPAVEEVYEKGVALIRSIDPAAKNADIIQQESPSKNQHKFSGAGRFYKISKDCTELITVAAHNGRTLNKADARKSRLENIRAAIEWFDPAFAGSVLAGAESDVKEVRSGGRPAFLFEETGRFGSVYPVTLADGELLRFPKYLRVDADADGGVTLLEFRTRRGEMETIWDAYRENGSNARLLPKQTLIDIARNKMAGTYRLHDYTDRMETSMGKAFVPSLDYGGEAGMPACDVEVSLALSEWGLRPVGPGEEPVSNPLSLRDHYTAIYTIDMTDGRILTAAYC